MNTPTPKLTIDEIQRRVDEIREIAWDGEAAHGREDELYRDVLQAISAGAQNPAELANAALATQDIEFDRWYA